MIRSALPESRVFGPSRPKVALLVGVLVGVGAACYFFRNRNGPQFALALSGLFTVVAIGMVISAVRGYPRLTLDAQGVEFATLLNSTRYRWSDFHEFKVARMLGWRSITLKFSQSYVDWRIARSVSRGMVGFEGFFPGVFSVSINEVYTAMRAFQRRSQREA
jgi:hypothetical protein